VTRLVLLVAVVGAALAAMLLSSRRAEVAEPTQLTYVATAHQLGVVGYRDPVGVISADGRRVALAEGRRLFETPSTGGARIELAAAEGQIRHIARGPAPDEWIFEDTAASQRWWVVSSRSQRRPLFGDREELTGLAGSTTTGVRVNALRQLATSPDGSWIAATAAPASGAELWRIAVDGSRADVVRLQPPASMASPAWTATGEIACTTMVERRSRLSLPCGSPAVALNPDVDVIGPLASSSDGSTIFFASPNAAGTVDLWSADPRSRRARRETTFSRDSYAPSISADGGVLFKVQSYRTSVAELDLTTHAFQQLSTLQAETPSYHPDGRRIAVTYGTWRRLIDDAKYPDIAQEIGVIAAMPVQTPADKPLEIVAASDSEDQAMAWSPNGRWIVLHSHREQSDDIWLRPADGSAPDRRVSFLGRGAEVGWPRWSPDGRWVLYDGASPATGKSAMFILGIDHNSGEVADKGREVLLTGFDGDITHGEWLPDSATIVAIAKEAPGRHAILVVPAAGGAARVVHRFASEHDFPGLAVAPDGTRVAFIAPAPDGFFQVFQLPMSGGEHVQLTGDPTHKTQPAWSPDGRRIAFTVWSYEAQFWLLNRRN
jgi:Tol biopolymer transport system component